NTGATFSTYHLQVAGNFATVEGPLCVSLRKAADLPPANDQCTAAQPVSVGGACVAGDNTGATFSGYRPPCLVEAQRDIWFSFVAPASGSVLLNTGADFEHAVAVWEGACDSLSAVFCAKNPQRCAGYVLVPNLHAGDTYRVQIVSWSQAAQPGTGQVCLSILPGNATPPFQPLTLIVKEVCVGENIAKINITTAGGVAPLSFQGTADDQLIASGTPYLTVVTDAMGCEQMHLGVVKACSTNDCALTASISAQPTLCFDGSDGSLAANLAGGMPPYVYAWSNGGKLPQISGLAAGTYTLSVTDAIGCELTLSAMVSAPAEIVAAATQLQQPHQGQSDGSIQVDVSGGTGAYTFAWLLQGAPFSQSEDLVNAPAGEYTLMVTDANACQRSFPFVLTAISSTSFPAEQAFAEVFPNPAADRAMLTLAFPEAQVLYLSIVDAEGRVLHSQTEHQVTERTLSLDVHSLPAGTYQVHLLTGRGLQLTRKLVVER
ncbi:MAG TPA: T9SS type A sorting domain-containing protein, partial [Saprospiraceae bacterium]|nr:T9SS type A sorting domain-containing protein [Saprospiraceae bacterium]